MKRFNAVPGAMIGLLKNQDASLDAHKAATLTAKLAAFADSLDDTGAFCHGSTPTLADVRAPCLPPSLSFSPACRLSSAFESSFQILRAVAVAGACARVMGCSQRRGGARRRCRHRCP